MPAVLNFCCMKRFKSFMISKMPVRMASCPTDPLYTSLVWSSCFIA